MTVALCVGGLRVGLGLGMLALPRVLRLGLRSPALGDDAVLAFRMVGARDTVLGVGTLMARRRGPGAVRGWTEAGALVDALDAGIMSQSDGLKIWARVLGVTAATVAAVAGFAAARALTR